MSLFWRWSAHWRVGATAIVLAAAALAGGCAWNRTPKGADADGFTLVSPAPDRLLGGSLDYAYRIRSVVDLEPTPPQGLAAPSPIDGTAFWGTLPVGPWGGRLTCLVDQPKTGPIRARIDADLDGDLAKERAEEWLPLARPVWVFCRDVAVADPAKPGRPPAILRMQFTFNAQPFLQNQKRRVSVECFASWRGKASFGSTRVITAVFPSGENLRTPIGGTRLAVDLDGDERLDDAPDSAEHMNSEETIPFEGKAWRLKRLNPAGGAVEFEMAGGAAPSRPLLRIGDPAPPFEAETATGGRFRLDDQKGLIVLLQFWSARDGGSFDAIPALQRLVDLYGPKGLSLARLNLDRPDALEPHNAPLLGVPWVELAGTGARDDPVARLYRVWDAPWSLLIDREGVIRAKNLSATALEQAIDRLAESPPSSAPASQGWVSTGARVKEP